MKVCGLNDKWKNVLRKYGMADIYPEQVAPVLQIREYDDGEYLTRKGQTAFGLGIILQGRVKVVPLSVDGKEIVLSYLSPPDVIGDIELFTETCWMHSTQAAGKVVTLFIPGDIIATRLMDYNPFLRWALKITTVKLVKHSRYSSVTQLYGVRGRLFRYLWDQSIRLQSSLIPFSVCEEAQFIGISERHLRRVIHQLEEEGLIEKYPRAIKILDSDALRDEVEKEES